ncbi:MAG: HEAT repeat domain-containing protein [Planctomycetota bacterium]|nr:HEAT repeat domain-containing protein [Planctomycetota bacterium]
MASIRALSPAPGAVAAAGRRVFLAAVLVALLVASAATADTIVMTDGSVVEGVIVDETPESVTVQSGMEKKTIARSRISKVVRADQQEGMGARKYPPEELRDVYAKIREVGSPLAEKRREAIEKAKALGEPAAMALIAALNPSQVPDEWERIGALRALAAMNVADPLLSKTLAWSAIKDPSQEVRREAAATIRQLKDSQAVGLILGHALASHDDTRQRRLAAWALREIDDPRAFAALVGMVKPGEKLGHGNITGVRRIDVKGPVLPGLGATPTVPIFLPEGEAAGTEANPESPAARVLKDIAGKDLGNDQSAWAAWLAEKLAVSSPGQSPDDGERKKSLREKLGIPPNTSPPAR